MAQQDPEPDGARPLGGRTILAVFAHPDDESLACGGTLRRLADLGARTVLVCASRGELGAGASANAREVGDMRARELGRAAGALGLSTVWLLKHPDGSLRWSDHAGLQAAITLATRRFRPDLIITFGEDGLYWHPDHIGVHEQTVMALRALGSSAPPLYGVTMPEGAMRGLYDAAMRHGWRPPADGVWSVNPDAWGAHAPAPTVDLDVSDWVTGKVAAIVSHASQVGVSHPLAILDLTTVTRWLGRELFHIIPAGTPARPVPDLLGHLP
jgi:LmbE family N-acetylglucosaminyl deacetylase